MRIKAISIAVVAPLVAVIVVGVLKIPLAAAQVEATSTPPTADLVSTSTGPSFTDTAATSTDSSDTTSTASSSTPAIESASQDLTWVHIIGTKYIDYFTDGTNVYTFPGDPEIHAHIAEKDAPIPTRTGLTWVHSTGQYLYDTPSGDLEAGQYALQPSGAYIQKAHPFVSATSSAATTVPESGTTTITASTTASSPSDTGPSAAESDADNVPPAEETSATSSSTQ